MKIILSAAYFPPIDYMRVMTAGSIRIEAHESYARQSYRNRCYVPAANGKTALTVPVNATENTIDSIKISYKQAWQKQHWKTLISAYNNSPFFSYYADRYKIFFDKQYEFLFDLNTLITAQLCKDLDLDFPMVTEYWEKDPVNAKDLRNAIHPKKPPVIPVKPYYQVFSDKYGFQENCSVIDLLFNLGPEAGNWLKGK